MVYPQFKDKHLKRALFDPEDFVNYKEWDKDEFPKKYILIYQEEPLRYFKRKYKVEKKIRLHSRIDIHLYKDIGFVKITGIGCPNVITVFEELIALGGKEFLSLGTAGGLRKQGTFLCQKALRDEGTSFHYISHGQFSYPNKKLTKKLGKIMEKQGIKYEKGTTWTIDAPYRETKAEVQKYIKKGISTVEMEASALFAVARVRNVKIAGAFVVSDVLGDKWEPQFHAFDLKKGLHKLIDVGMECLR